MPQPQRIVSLVPSQTELLFDLGLDEAVVGITKFCVHPADKVRNKTVVGGTKTPDLARIDALRPDLILANKEENTREAVETLRERYAVYVTDVVTLPDALAMIRDVGALVGKVEAAHALAGEINRRFERLSVPQPPAQRPRVAYLIWRKPYMVVANDTFIHALLEAAGFRNAFANQTRYPEVTPETLREAQPDWVFLSSEPYPFGPKHTAELAAICPSARVRLVDGELFSWYGSRLLQSVDYLGKLPEEIARSEQEKA